jgi:hypothetical protein
MSKPKGRRRTLRDELRRRRAIAERAGGEVCATCGQVVPFDQATFYSADGKTVAYCLECAFSSDAGGYVAMLWAALDETHRSEGGREVAPPSSCEALA